MNTLYIQTYRIGLPVPITMASDDREIRMLTFRMLSEEILLENGKKRNFSDRIYDRILYEENSLLNEAAGQLREYLAGKRRTFSLPLNPTGTVFQKKVWASLLEIPYGETRTYGQIAERIGSPKACRAVGMANHCNPIAIFIPCHRVIGADGSLTGYAGGMETKAFLLGLEKIG